MQPTGPDAIAGCLLGCAVGDSIGLPYEGLSTRRARRYARLPLRHRFLAGRGMVSDDTDHTLFVAQALIRSRGDVVAFRNALAWRLRLWLLCLPAGIGWATLKSVIRLWLGFPESGVYSAGNGPAMRSAIIGVVFAGDAERRRAHVEASTRLTHTDPKAFAGALAVAEVAARIAPREWARKPALEDFVVVLARLSAEPQWQSAVKDLREACAAQDPIAAALERFGSRRGVSGYVLHSVPFALAAWYHHFGDYRATIEAITQAGGDVDTVAAIAGALAGASGGPEGIPAEWIDGVLDWPHGIAYARALALGLADPQSNPPAGFSPWLLPRGILFTLVVLLHGFRRLLPPY